MGWAVADWYYIVLGRSLTRTLPDHVTHLRCLLAWIKLLPVHIGLSHGRVFCFLQRVIFRGADQELSSPQAISGSHFRTPAAALTAHDPAGRFCSSSVTSDPIPPPSTMALLCSHLPPNHLSVSSRIPVSRSKSTHCTYRRLSRSPFIEYISRSMCPLIVSVLILNADSNRPRAVLARPPRGLPRGFCTSDTDCRHRVLPGMNHGACIERVIQFSVSLYSNAIGQQSAATEGY